MGKLFGTDGIRGRTNEYPMTAETSLWVGRAVAIHFCPSGRPAKIVIGRDTRLSGDMFEAAIVAGISSAGADAVLAGVIPTPAVAFLTTALKADAGIVISASHNPYYDNGIKIFGADGFKLSDETEAAIEALVLQDHAQDGADDPPQSRTGSVLRLDDAPDAYRRFLKNSWPADLSLTGLNLVLDCANGATYRVAPALFSELGATIHVLGSSPDGTNINSDCGSEHPAKLIEQVVARQADAGLAFDGDGDRLIAVDETGNVLSGDQILAICAASMHRKGELDNDVVVSTVMSNLGLAAALKEMQIRHETAAVGDRYVVQKMIASGAVLGGEDSGHMIFLNSHTTGDGILSALKLLEALRSQNRSLSDLRRIMTVYPQELINVEVSAKPEFERLPELVAAIKKVESELGDKGRVLVRYSGTQPLCRVMVEGPVKEITQHYCTQLSEIIKKHIGTGG